MTMDYIVTEINPAVSISWLCIDMLCDLPDILPFRDINYFVSGKKNGKLVDHNFHSRIVQFKGSLKWSFFKFYMFACWIRISPIPPPLRTSGELFQL